MRAAVVKLGRRPGCRTHAFEYPLCPRCDSGNVKRAGFADGIQRFRCLDCRRTFSGVISNIRELPAQVPLICHRCGGYDVQPIASGKGRGRCRVCNKLFTQGGPRELDRNRALLMMRVDALEAPDDVRAAVLVQACLDVLEGRGYCWTVELRLKDAWGEVAGGYGRESGQYHPVYRAAVGEYAGREDY